MSRNGTTTDAAQLFRPAVRDRVRLKEQARKARSARSPLHELPSRNICSQAAKRTIVGLEVAQLSAGLTARIRQPFDLALLLIGEIWKKQMLAPSRRVRNQRRNFAIRSSVAEQPGRSTCRVPVPKALLNFTVTLVARNENRVAVNAAVACKLQCGGHFARRHAPDRSCRFSHATDAATEQYHGAIRAPRGIHHHRVSMHRVGDVATLGHDESGHIERQQEAGKAVAMRRSK